MSSGALPPWDRRDNFGLLAHQRVVERLNHLSVLSPAEGCETHQAPSGTGIVDQRQNRRAMIFRMKVTDATAGTDVVLARPWDGTSFIGDEVAVRSEATHADDDEVNGYQPVGGTDKTYASAPVTWREVGGGGGGLFPVRVTQTGGSNVNPSTQPATWTYTVKALDNVTVLGTAVPVTKPRPNGLITAGVMYGLAFYDGAALKLWDAGEVAVTSACPA